MSQPWLLEAVGTARWRGVPVAATAEEAGLRDGAVDVLFTGLDRAWRVMRSRLRAQPPARGPRRRAPRVRGERRPLPPQHGFPLRLVVPGWYGMTSVKWLGHHRAGRAVRWVSTAPPLPAAPARGRRGRAALSDPAAFPDDPARYPRVPHEIPRRSRPARVAWRGAPGRAEPRSPPSRSGGRRRDWAAAELGGDALGRWAWRSWSSEWEATSGEHRLCSRATALDGSTQPLDAPWNLGGYANNAVQRIQVTVSG